MRIRAAISPWHLLLVGALALAWLAIACGGDEGTQPEDAPTPSTAGGSVADDAGEQHTPGLCIPAAPLAASVGDMWTLSGTTRTTGRPTEDTFQSPIEVTTSYTVKAFEDGLWYVRGQTYLVGRSKVRVQSTSSVRDGEGTAQAPQVEELERSTIQAANMGPLLTLDWECHRESWLEAWSEDASTAETQPEPTVEERTLSSGLTVVVFSVKQVLDQPEEGIEGTVERSLGYDKATGRLVLIETLGSGTRNGEPFSSETMQELVADSAPRETSPPASDAPTDVSVPAPIESVEIEYMAGSPPDTSPSRRVRPAKHLCEIRRPQADARGRHDTSECDELRARGRRSGLRPGLRHGRNEDSPGRRDRGM